MARIIGQVESLKSLKSELNKRRIYRFNSIGDINRFNLEYKKEKQKILKSYEDLLIEEIKQKSNKIIENEKKLESLKNDEISRLNREIENYKNEKADLESKRNSFIGKALTFFRIKKINRRLTFLVEYFDLIISDSIRGIKDEIDYDSISIQYLLENKQKAIIERSRGEINEIDLAKKTIDELKPLIAGAIGESMVVKEIERLSDDYILINDFSLKFNPPIYNHKTDDRIYSIQIDHLLVSKAGLFILETKNWSKESINSLDLRSPVDQIIRASYALFVVINNGIQLGKHHWGKKQIPMRNIIVMINEKPKDVFKYVKVKQLKELNSYVEYFDPIFSKNEVESIADFLVYMT